jgi:hypothetical protein
MWMISASFLCNKHLLGEHGEIHKFKHTFEKKYSIHGRIHPVVQIEPASMKIRHDELADEMLKRGMKHESPYTMPDISYLKQDAFAKVDINKSKADLSERCAMCGYKIEKGDRCE